MVERISHVRLELADLYGTIGAVVAYFDERGIRKGDRVLIWAENRMEWVAVFWACVATGVEAIPVDFRFSEDLVQRIQSESKPKLVADRAMLDEIAALSRVPTFQATAVTPDDWHRDCSLFEKEISNSYGGPRS